MGNPTSDLIRRIEESKVVGFDTQHGNFVILVGAANSGKSVARKALNLRSWKFFSLDVFIEAEARMRGIELTAPETARLHGKYRVSANKLRNAFIGNQGGDELPNVVYETTGANKVRTLETIRKAQGVGFVVSVVYVRSPLKELLRRNALRSRKVPEEVIIDDFEMVDKNISELYAEANHAWEVDNGAMPSFADLRGSELIVKIK